tara:strand:- start:146655 stop:147221 length:567 start_codon:yes stop_codon:yes gene_type:complete
MSHVALPPANYAELEQMTATPIEGSGWEELFDYTTFEAKMCYTNVAKVMLNNPDRELRYVLGYICSGNLAKNIYIAHAWLETADGTLLDPTFDLVERNHLDMDDTRYVYFPRIKMTEAEFDAYLEKMELERGAMYAPDHSNIQTSPELVAKLAPFEDCDGLTRMINHVGHHDLGWSQEEQRFTKERED